MSYEFSSRAFCTGSRAAFCTNKLWLATISRAIGGSPSLLNFCIAAMWNACRVPAVECYHAFLCSAVHWPIFQPWMGQAGPRRHLFPSTLQASWQFTNLCLYLWAGSAANSYRPDLVAVLHFWIGAQGRGHFLGESLQCTIKFRKLGLDIILSV